MARKEISHIFIDESGDAGFQLGDTSSKYYLVGAAFFPQSKWEECRDALTAVLLERRGLKPCDDGTILNCHPKTYKQYLRHFVNHEGLFGCVYVEKRRISNHVSNIVKREKGEDGAENPSVYDKMVKQLLTQFLNSGGFSYDIHAHIHKSQGDFDRRSRINYLVQEINGLSQPFRLSVSHKRSEGVVGIQCVHLICNGLFQRFEKEDTEHYNFIKKALIVEEHYKKE